MKLYQVLVETYLFEYDQSKTIQALGAQLVKAARADRTMHGHLPESDQEVAQYVLGQLEKADPTPHKEYTQWMARQYAAGQGRIFIEDMISTAADALAKYDVAKKKKKLAPEYRDINRITVQNLHQVLSTLPQDEEPANADKGKSEQVYEDQQVRVIHLQDEAAAKYYGRGTKWCTAATNNNQFEYYNSAGKIYVMLVKNSKGEKYQIHFETRQFMDPQDDEVDQAELWDKFPGARKYFASLPEHKATFIFHALSNQEAQGNFEHAKQLGIRLVENAQYGLTESWIQTKLYELAPAEHIDGANMLGTLTNILKQRSHEIQEAFDRGEEEDPTWYEYEADQRRTVGNDWFSTSELEHEIDFTWVDVAYPELKEVVRKSAIALDRAVRPSLEASDKLSYYGMNDLACVILKAYLNKVVEVAYGVAK